MVSHKFWILASSQKRKKESVNPGPEVLHYHTLLDLYLWSFKKGSQFTIYLSALIAHLLNLLGRWNLNYLYSWAATPCLSLFLFLSFLPPTNL